jgi:hypothetical protein
MEVRMFTKSMARPFAISPGISVNYVNFRRTNNAGYFHRIFDFIAS